MTALLAPKSPGERRDRWARLRAVAQPDRRLSSLPFVLVVAMFMVAGMVGLLVLNTSLQDQAFEVRKQQRVANELGYQLAALEAQATEARSAGQLAMRASQLGMRANPYPVYLTLPDGRIVGDPTAVTGGEVPELRYRTPEQLQAEADARAKAEADAKAKAEADAKAKAEADAKAKAEADAKAKAEATKKKTGGNG